MSDTPDMSENGNTQNLFDFDRSKGNFSFPERHKFDAGYGLTEATIDYICDVKEDPEWVRQFRKNALAVFESKPMPTHWASPPPAVCTSPSMVLPRTLPGRMWSTRLPASFPPP